MMKRSILILSICFFALCASAQKFGIKAGLNFANGNYELSTASLSTSSLTCFQLGVIGDFPVSQDLYFNTGLLYMQKGLKMDMLGVEVKLPINYLEVPFNLAYKYDLGGAVFFAQAGPYLGIGLSAKAKSGDEEEDMDFGDGDGEIKRMDFGLNVGTGIEINAIQLGINYGLGLVDLENDPDAEFKNGVLSFTVGYFF
ncbi:MAG: porin family protein [Mangrovibacterium sp.]